MIICLNNNIKMYVSWEFLLLNKYLIQNKQKHFILKTIQLIIFKCLTFHTLQTVLKLVLWMMNVLISLMCTHTT